VVVYFNDGPLVLETREQDGTVYLAVEPLLERLALGRTDATGFGTLTIRGPVATIELSNGSPVIASEAGDHEMAAPALREDGRWWAPPGILTVGLARATGRGFSIEAEGRRIVDSELARAALDMNVAATDTGARLTIQSGESVNIRVQQDRDRNQVVLSIDRAPLDPVRESLNYRDTTIRAVRFDDTDGNSKIVVETGPLASVRLVPVDGNRSFYVDFFPANAPLAADPAAAPDSRASAGAVRVIAIDAGHGGLDSGTTARGTLEKDLTLALAEQLRMRLEAELDATVVMTRRQDREMDVETRTSIANNSRASLLISLHVGYSPDETESLASLFVMRPLEDLPGAVAGENLFRPWYRAHVASRSASQDLAELVRERLVRTLPQWGFVVHEAPLAILVGAALPAVVIEVGNINNPEDLEALGDAGFRAALIDGIISGVVSFGRARP
jgi:N-acetylmuramoyl-L-alanine amidase